MILDLFAGPGGWDEALRLLGRTDIIGIEWDATACATRTAAGHRTIRASVAEYPPALFVGRVEGLIASPPCPTFSMAGSGEGTAELPHLLAAVRVIATDGWVDPWTLHEWSDPRTPLVLEPLRWVLAIRPTWVALEQVPAVMPLWDEYVRMFRQLGYSAWAGVLDAECFGVPQTRDRAILMAHADRPCHPPTPTHQRYVPGEAQWDGPQTDLFGTRLPWVSMAEALGWGANGRPCVTVTGGGTKAGGPEPLAHVGAWRERERERSLDSEGRGVRA
jgi:DNA (cytosine-5)-methyltransferase 1